MAVIEFDRFLFTLNIKLLLTFVLIVLLFPMLQFTLEKNRFLISDRVKNVISRSVQG